MPRLKAKKDANQTEVTDLLRKLGVSVAFTHQLGKGFPDFVIGYAGLDALVELKTDDKKKLTEHEERFCDNWQGCYIVGISASDILSDFYTHHRDHINSDLLHREIAGIIIKAWKEENDFKFF